MKASEYAATSALEFQQVSCLPAESQKDLSLALWDT